MKKLYFLHIPKTAGKFVSNGISKSLPEHSASLYISTHFPNNKEFLSDKIYISAHAGTYIPDTLFNLKDFVHNKYIPMNPNKEKVKKVSLIAVGTSKFIKNNCIKEK